MLTRREVEGELRQLHSFRAAARDRRAERERARRFAMTIVGVFFGVGLIALLGAVNLLDSGRADIAYGKVNTRGSESVHESAAPAHRSLSLFFTGRRTWHPADPRGRHRTRSAPAD